MYSAPSASGVEYCTHSPRSAITAWPGPYVHFTAAMRHAQHSLDHDRVLIKLRRLSRLNPSAGTAHVRNAQPRFLRVHAPDKLVDQLRLVARGLDAQLDVR